MELPLAEDDLDSPGVIEPSRVFRPSGAPSALVMCFFPEVVAAQGDRVHTQLRSIHGKRPLFETDVDGERVAFCHAPVGAPAAVLLLEEAIALGCRDIIGVGGAGALIDGLDVGHPVVADSAVRDEGTSLHYLRPGRTVEAHPDAVAAIVQTLDAAQVPYTRGRTWTTDALYRETRERVDRRVAEGCLTVEMEAAAFFAVGAYRGVRVGQLLFAGDALHGDDWDHRGWFTAADARTATFLLALDAAARLARRPRLTRG